MAIDGAQAGNGPIPSTDAGKRLAAGDDAAKSGSEAFVRAFERAVESDGELSRDERADLRRQLAELDAGASRDAYRALIADKAAGAGRDPDAIRALFDMLTPVGQQHLVDVVDRAAPRAQLGVIEALAPVADEDHRAAAATGRILLDMPTAQRGGAWTAPGAVVREAVEALAEAGTLERVLGVAAATEPWSEQRFHSSVRPLIASHEFDNLVAVMVQSTGGADAAALHADVFNAATEVFNAHHGGFDPESKTDALGVLGGMLLASEGALDSTRAPAFHGDSIKDFFEVAIKALDGSGIVARGSALLIASTVTETRAPLDRFANELVQAAEAGESDKVDALRAAYYFDGTGASQTELAERLESVGLDPAFADIAADAHKLERLQGLLLDAADRAAEDRGEISATVVNIVGGTLFGAVSVLKPGDGASALSPFLADGLSQFVREQFSPESQRALEKIPSEAEGGPRTFTEVVQALGQPRLADDHGGTVPIERGGIESGSTAADLIRELRERFHGRYEGRDH